MTEWRVYVSRFPMGEPIEILGTVKANGRRSAEIMAEKKWGNRVVVEPVIADERCAD